MSSVANISLTLTPTQLRTLIGDVPIPDRTGPTGHLVLLALLDNDTPLLKEFLASPIHEHGCVPTLFVQHATDEHPVTLRGRVPIPGTFRVTVGSQILSRSRDAGLDMPAYRDTLAQIVTSLLGTTTDDPSLELCLDPEL